MSDYKIQNKELHEKLQLVVHKAYTIATPLMGKEIIEEYLRKTEHDYYHIHRYLKYSYSFFFQQFVSIIEKCEPEIKNSKEYSDFIETISNDSVITQHNHLVGMLGSFQRFDE